MWSEAELLKRFDRSLFIVHFSFAIARIAPFHNDK
jgi:hypothetical protein